MFFADNDSRKWGNRIAGLEVYPPDHIKEVENDVVVICVNETIYSDISQQLIDDLEIPVNKIRHWTYWMRIDFLNYYHENMDKAGKEGQDIIKYVERRDRLVPFNYSYTEKYKEGITCFYDEQCGMFYGYYKNHRVYLNKSFRTRRQSEEYIKSLLIEQDIQSPHRYLSDDFNVDGECVLDAGVAEGNFALEVIEKVAKVILVEADPLWNEALMKTFEPWKDKIVIINKYLSDADGDNTITIDALANSYPIDFVKLDIEGAEVNAIKGGMGYLSEIKKIKMAVCTYHNIDDEIRLREILEPMGFDAISTKGYMVFLDNTNQPPRLVRGVLRLTKK